LAAAPQNKKPKKKKIQFTLRIRHVAVGFRYAVFAPAC